jgi:hypothetical protein
MLNIQILISRSAKMEKKIETKISMVVELVHNVMVRERSSIWLLGYSFDATTEAYRVHFNFGYVEFNYSIDWITDTEELEECWHFNLGADSSVFSTLPRKHSAVNSRVLSGEPSYCIHYPELKKIKVISGVPALEAFSLWILRAKNSTTLGKDYPLFQEFWLFGDIQKSITKKVAGQS